MSSSFACKNSNSACVVCLAVVAPGHQLRTVPSNSGCLLMLARKLSGVHLSCTYAGHLHNMCSDVSCVWLSSQPGLLDWLVCVAAGESNTQSKHDYCLWLYCVCEQQRSGGYRHQMDCGLSEPPAEGSTHVTVS